MTPAGDAILAMLLRLFAGLRDGGVDVSLGEVLDAAAAMRHIDLLDREALRTALQSTLIKRPEDLAIFSSLFDECFPRRRAAPAAALTPADIDRGDDTGVAAPQPYGGARLAHAVVARTGLISNTDTNHGFG